MTFVTFGHFAFVFIFIINVAQKNRVLKFSAGVTSMLLNCNVVIPSS